MSIKDRSCKLIAMTDDPRKVIYISARMCYSKNLSFDDLDAEYHAKDYGEVSKYLLDLFQSGHHSVFEHASFTFALTNVTRTMLAQITRHRLASFSVRGQRYNEVDDERTAFANVDLTKLKPGLNKKDVEEELDGLYFDIMQNYKELIREGIPKDDARGILPGNTYTNMTVTMNLRELMHFCNMRMCMRASEEIRWFANKMKIEAYDATKDPVIISMLVPNCEIHGICPEKKKFSCGKHPTYEDVTSVYHKFKTI